jgi:hypothetical protein
MLINQIKSNHESQWLIDCRIIKNHTDSIRVRGKGLVLLTPGWLIYYILLGVFIA